MSANITRASLTRTPHIATTISFPPPLETHPGNRPLSAAVWAWQTTSIGMTTSPPAAVIFPIRILHPLPKMGTTMTMLCQSILLRLLIPVHPLPSPPPCLQTRKRTEMLCQLILLPPSRSRSPPPIASSMPTDEDDDTEDPANPLSVCFVVSDHHALPKHELVALRLPGAKCRSIYWALDHIDPAVPSNKVFFDLLIRHSAIVGGHWAASHEEHRFWVWEWLLLVLHLCIAGCNVEFMSWPTFRDALLLTKGPTWTKLTTEFQVVLGGRDITNDLGGVSTTGITVWNVHRYLIAANILCESVVCWPFAMDLVHFGKKLTLQRCLSNIVPELQIIMPSPIKILSQQQGVHLLESKQYVIKREYSCEAHHVIIPGRHSAQAFIDQWADTERTFSSLPEILRPLFFAVPFNPDILDKGEVRSFTSGGKVRYSLHTIPKVDQPGTWETMEVFDLVPLHLLKRGRKMEGALGLDNDYKGWADPQLAEQKLTLAGYTSLRDFVERVVEVLITF
ncbi:hypothetical protein B0H10DRAFT_2087168 [Mycena sp. CBHHK59/15]|nr:hypothetical protein B0H10DRAFT_2087168 [Mycena sp. CBHHK59/15]